MRTRDLLLIFLAFLPATAFGRIIHVPADSATVQAAINGAENGDTVLVAPGNYVGKIDFLGKTVVVTSSGGAVVTTLSPGASGTMIAMVSGEGEGTEFSGFTITGVENPDGHVVETDNDARPVIAYNIFRENNTAAGEEIISCNSAALIYRNLFHDNGGISCVGLRSGAEEAQIINNTFANNARAFFSIIGSGTAINNIVANSVDYGIYGQFTYADYNLVWGNAPDYDGDAQAGSHDIAADPMFTDPESDDYELHPLSPCVNAGHPDPQYNDPDGSQNDIGAYPLTATMPIPQNLSLGEEDLQHVVNHQPTFYWSYYDTAATTQAGFEIEVGTDNEWTVAEMWQSAQVFSPDTSIQYDGAALQDSVTYYCRIRLFSGFNWGEWVARAFRMNSRPNAPYGPWPRDGELVSVNGVRLTVHTPYDAQGDPLTIDFEVYSDPGLTTLVASEYEVSADSGQTRSSTVTGLQLGEEYWWRSRACDGYECSGWLSAVSFVTREPLVINVPADQPTIQAGINEAGDGDTVLIAPGTYTGDGNRDMDFYGKLITLLSSDGPDVTIIDCEANFDDPHRAIHFHSGEDTRAVVSGLTFRHGSAADIHSIRRGGAIYCEGAGPTVANCTFDHNTAFYGALCFRDCDVRLFDCKMQSNFLGSAVWIRDCPSVVISNCDFVGNGGGPGAIDAGGSSIELLECHFQYNIGVFLCPFGGIGGATFFEFCDVLVENCRFDDNIVYGVGAGIGGWNSSITCRASTFHRNESRYCGEMEPWAESDVYHYGGTAYYENCTIAGGSVSYSGAAVFLVGGVQAIFENSIIAHTTNAKAVNGFGIFYCCDIYGNEGGDWTDAIADQLGFNGNVSVDPMFCDTASGDLRVDSSSVCAPTNNDCGVLIGANPVGCQFICGDVDFSGVVNVSDAVYLIAYIFGQGPPPNPLFVADVDCNEIVNISDVVYLITYIFAGGPVPCAACP